ncbi:MAG: succinate dehydrogenase, cytochrome b556 subunit [Acetobacteraceae bacterium]|nr:succinate dehydrogenase, cytochrome b556 subunit [Acetobacteraceae bacterium]
METRACAGPGELGAGGAGARVRRVSPLHPANAGVGMYAFLLHRITGLALVFYVLLHIPVISSAMLGAASFDGVMALLHTKFWVVLDVGLLAAVIFHGLNGLRLLLFDLGLLVKQQKLVFWIIFALSAAGVAFCFWIVLPVITA